MRLSFNLSVGVKMEAPKLKPLPLIRTMSRRKWIFCSDWRIEVPIYGNIVIPANTVTDGATVPRLLWGIFSPTGALFLPALVHDFAIAHGYLLVDGGRHYLDNREADQLFYLICLRQGVNTLATEFAYIGVRLGSLFRKKK